MKPPTIVYRLVNKPPIIVERSLKQKVAATNTRLALNNKMRVQNILDHLTELYNQNSQDIDPTQPSWSAETCEVVSGIIEWLKQQQQVEK